MAEPIVLIHGLYNLLFDIDAKEQLSPHAVLIPDLLGYGENSETPREEISIEAQADYIRRLLDKSGYERAHLVGHSVGGAVAVVFAHRHAERVASLINVEGNFTLKDAFWSKKMATMPEEGVRELLEIQRGDPEKWLAGMGIDATPERTAIARRGLLLQSAGTVQAMARSVVEVTQGTEYLKSVEEILDRGVTMHLVAGERSRGGWDVPEFVLRRAASMTIQPGVGHLMIVEDPAGFLRIVAKLVG